MALGCHAASLFYETDRSSSSAELEMTAEPIRLFYDTDLQQTE